MTSQFIAPIWEGENDEFVVPPIQRNLNEVKIIRADETVYYENINDTQTVVVVVPHPTAFERIWCALAAIYDKCTAEELVGLVWRIVTFIVAALWSLITRCCRVVFAVVCALACACVYLLSSAFRSVFTSGGRVARKVMRVWSYTWRYTLIGILLALIRTQKFLGWCSSGVVAGWRIITSPVMGGYMFVRRRLITTQFLGVAVLLAMFLLLRILSPRVDDYLSQVTIITTTTTATTITHREWSPFTASQPVRGWKPFTGWPPVRSFYALNSWEPFNENQTEPAPHEFIPSSMPPPSTQVRVVAEVQPQIPKGGPLALDERCSFARRICVGVAQVWHDTTITSAARRGLRVERSSFLRAANVPQSCDLMYPIFECEQPDPAFAPTRSDPGVPWEMLRVGPSFRVVQL